MQGLVNEKKGNSFSYNSVFIQAASSTSTLADRPFTAPDHVKNLIYHLNTSLDLVPVYNAEK